ncbi:MAG TPA: HEAT repeat domain-containing protein, partial [Ktedonobacterales bacterium]
EAPGVALHRWMAEHRTLQPARVRRSVPLQLSEELTQQVLSAAITADILRLAVDGRSISFAHGIITASYAADWLIAQDDETLPLDGILLRPMIAPAFMHWAGRIERPFTLGQRALGLRRGSTTVARQAGLSEQVPTNNASLALATLATCTGVAIRLAYARREGGNPAQAIVGSEAFMRDILDETQQTLADPQEARAFLQPLRTLRSYLGQDTDAAINALATEPQLSRLTRAQLFNLLGALATPAALTMLAASLPETDPTLRAGVNRGFELAGSAAIHFLQEEMNSGDARISARAREVLVGLGNTSIAASPTALYTTLRTLSTVSGPERAASIQALGAINSPEAHDALVGALDDDDSQVRAAAVTALAQRRDPISLPLLRARVTMPDPQMRAALAQGLANYSYPEQLSDLSALLADTDGRVRTAAARSLGMVGDERAIPLLDQHRADPDPRTQVTVLAALRRLRGG